MTKTKKLCVCALLSCSIVIGASVGSGLVSAETTSGPFHFVVSTSHKSDSSYVQKTNSQPSASVNVEYYKNNSNDTYLMVRVRRGNLTVTDPKHVSRETAYSASYYANKYVTQGQSLYLRGMLSNNATSGDGEMLGNWTP